MGDIKEAAIHEITPLPAIGSYVSFLHHVIEEGLENFQQMYPSNNRASVK